MTTVEARRSGSPAEHGPPAAQDQDQALSGRCIPRHVAIIMDGNGRWARDRGLGRQAGHRAGTENIRRVLERFCEHGVRYVTLFAFSTENWRRPTREVRGLMGLAGFYLRREVRHLHDSGIRLRHLGHLEVLDRGVQQQIRDAVELTRGNTRLTLSVAFNYGGRREIVDAVRRIAAAGIPLDQVDEQVLSAHMDTAELPDPDLIIRTGGEMRLSNFLLWQSAYSEYYSTKAFWPDFDSTEVDAALRAYEGRTRRFGALPDDQQA
jgi:undecaprenyl diphosphate synthase